MRIEEQIKNELLGLDHDKFQMFSEDFVQLKFPHVYKLIIPTGRNLQGITTKGQPDAKSFYQDGCAAVEATITARGQIDYNKIRQSLKNKILKKDLPALKKKFVGDFGPIKHIVFTFSNYIKDRPENERRDLIVEISKELSIPKEIITLVYGEEIVTELAKNRRYRTIIQKYFKDISFIVEPFNDLISELNMKRAFFPSKDEFESGSVISDLNLLEYIKSNLVIDNQFAIIGEGASGKTTHSFLIGWDFLKNENYEVLYLDFKERGSEDVINKIHPFLEKNGHDKLLIIFDNFHLIKIEELYSELRRLQANNQFKVLYTGRKIISTPKDSDNDLFLSIYQKEGKLINLRGIPKAFRFIVQRFEKKKLLPIDYKKINFKELSNKFGRDLFIFSFAIESEKDDIDFNKLNPYKKEVGIEIEKRYIDPFVEDAQELENFIRLCAFCSLDLKAPKKIFITKTPYDNPLMRYREKGIVFETDKETYNLPHSSLGYLIFMYHCKEKDISYIPILSRLIKKVPEKFEIIVNNLMNQEKYLDDKLFIDVFKDKSFLLETLNNKNLLSTEQIFFIGNIYRAFPSIYFTLLKSNPKLFSDIVISKDLHSIRNFAYYFEKDASIFSIMLNALLNKETIIEKSRFTALHWLKDFLQIYENYSKISKGELGKKLEQSYFDIINSITDLNGKQNILSSCLNNSSLEYLRSFLEFIRPKKPKFHDFIINQLLGQEYRPQLIKRGLAHPLNHFTNFLDYVFNRGRFDPEDIIDDFKNAENFSILKRRLFEVPFDISFNFIKFWDKPKWFKGKKFYQELVAEMFSQENKENLIQLISNSNMIHVVNCFEFMKTNKIPQEFLKPEILDDTLMNPIVNRFYNLSFPQIVKMLNRLNNCGGVCIDLSDRFMILLTNTKIINNAFHSSSIFDKIRILEFLNDKGDKSKELSKKFLLALKNQKYFERWIIKTLPPYSNKRKPLFGKNYTTDLSILSYFINYLNNNDTNYFIKIFVKLKENENKIINLLLSEHIDKVGDFLRKLDTNDTSRVWSDELRKKLISDEYIDFFIRNSLSRDINYLTSVLEYHGEKFEWFLNPIFLKLKTQYFDRLVDTCSKSMPYQLIYFLNFLDKPREPKLEITSEMILKSLFMDGNKKKFFIGRYKKADESKRSQFTEYLIEKYPQYIKELAQFL